MTSPTWATSWCGHNMPHFNRRPGKEDGDQEGGPEWLSQSPGPNGQWVPLETATRRECPPWPAPGHGHRHVSLLGRGSVYFQGEAGSGFQVGVRGKSVLTHTPSQAALGCSSGTEPHSACPVNPPAWLTARIPGRVEKSILRRTPAPVGASPLHLSHILPRLPRRTRQTQSARKGPGWLQGESHAVTITQHPKGPVDTGLAGARGGFGIPPDTSFF